MRTRSWKQRRLSWVRGVTVNVVNSTGGVERVDRREDPDTGN